MSSDAQLLPPLRADLELISVGNEGQQKPGFIVRDIRSNTYIRIGRDTARILEYWEGGLKWSVFIQRLESNGIKISSNELEQCIRELTRAKFFDIITPTDEQPSWSKKYFQSFLKNYLFFKIPLFYPDQWINKCLPWASIFFTRAFFAITLIAGLVAIILVVPQWDRLSTSLSLNGKFETSLKFIIAFIFAKSVHELAHAFSAARNGCHVGSLGIGFMLGAPVFYADVTDTWRLGRAQARIEVAAAGIISEFYLAIYATWIWIINVNSTLSDIALFVALATWTSTILVNANPLMRFDGYYIFSDVIGVTNLQSRGFNAFGSWFRSIAFGLKRTDQESRLVLIYGMLSAIYRVIIVTSIALLLYYFVFRVLGLFLLLVEIWIFLLAPLLGQFKVAIKQRSQINLLRFFVTLSLVLAFLGILLFAPFNQSVHAPAIAIRAQTIPIFTQIDGQIETEFPIMPTKMEAGEAITTLKNEMLAIDQTIAGVEFRVIKERFDRLGFASHEREAYFSLAAELERAEIKLSRLKAQDAYLNLLAPQNGMFLPRQGHSIGDIVPNRARLGSLVAGPGQVIGFISEHDLGRIRVGAKALYFDSNGLQPLWGTVISIERFAIERLRFAQLSSVYGGPIRSHGTIQSGLATETALYRVLIDLGSNNDIVAVRMGDVAIRTEAAGLLPSLWKQLGQLIRREAYLD